MSFEIHRPHPAEAEMRGTGGRTGFSEKVRPGVSGTEVCFAMEKALARLERGVRAIAFASPWAALTTVILQFSAGDHLIADREANEETRRLIRLLAPRMGLSVSWTDPADAEALAGCIRPRTKAVLTEIPAGPRLKTADLAAVCRIAKAYRIRVIVDNTLLTPCFHRPIEQGADLVVHRGAHWLSGRHEARAGLVVAADEEEAGTLLAMRGVFGSFPDPVEAHRIREGLRTLQLRMEQAAKAAEKTALWLERHPGVRKVWYPGLPSHPGHEVMQAQSDGNGGVLVFDVGSPDRARRVMKRMNLPLMPLRPEDRERLEAVTPVLTRIVPEDGHGERESEGLLRLSVGTSDADALIGELDRALG